MADKRMYFSDGTEFTVESSASVRDVPQNRGVLNAYKKAQQLLNLNWTALAAIPTESNATGCAAGSHKGVLYSEALQFERYVGYGCSLRTFMTALHNPYSVMYTEDTHGTEDRKKSAYGFDYLNTTLNGAFYGTVCSGLTSYALGHPIIWQTYDLEWLTDEGVFERVYDNTGYGVQLMDIIWRPGHVRMVTDIYRNSRGVPTVIHVTESTKNYVKETLYTPETLSEYIQSNNGRIYRYKELYKNLEYAASPFVAVEGETPGSYVYNNDICTYMGDYVSVAEWESMYINYVKNTYTSMELYKGDTLIQTISLPAEYNATHSIDVTSYLTGGGEYKARLTDGTNHSGYTFFEIVETTTSAIKDGDDATVYFSATANPVCVLVKTLDGHRCCAYMLTNEDKISGVCTFKPSVLRNKQGRYAVQRDAYARVIFDGKYNQVMGGTVNTNIGIV